MNILIISSGKHSITIFMFQVKLSEIIDMNLVEKKGQLVIEIVTRSGRTYLRKPEGVREWFEQLKESREHIQKARILQRSFSLIESSCHQDDQDTVTSYKNYHADTVSSLNSHGEDAVTSLKSHEKDVVVTSLDSHGGSTVTLLNCHEGNTVIPLKSIPARPLMGCRSLRFAAKKDELICMNPNI